MDSYVGSVCAFGFNFVPIGWLACNGQSLPISEYAVLFNLIGTTYGGDGVVNFKLPDLQGRVPVHMGQGGGLPDYQIGQSAGSETVTLTSANMAAHIHQAAVQIPVNGSASNKNTPGGNYFGPTSGLYATAAGSSQTMANIATQTQNTGGSQPFYIIQSFTAINYCICYEGIYPSPS